MAQLVKYLLYKHEDLSLIPRTHVKMLGSVECSNLFPWLKKKTLLWVVWSPIGPHSTVTLARHWHALQCPLDNALALVISYCVQVQWQVPIIPALGRQRQEEEDPWCSLVS